MQALPLTTAVLTAFTALVALTACPAPVVREPSPPSPPVPPPYTFASKPLCAGEYAGTPVELGHLGDARLIEVSGVVPSPTTPDVLWVHNDSGDEPVIFALHADGRLRGIVRLPVAVSDVEDIAAATCTDGSGPCLFLADTGNNVGDRTDTAIIIIKEPLPEKDGSFAGDAVVVERLALADRGLPATIDIEAVAVVPAGDTILLIEKIDADSARVFALRAPFADADAVVIGTLRTESPAGIRLARMITAATIHPGGTALLVRTYTGVFESRFADVDALVALGDIAMTTVTFGPFTEPQGEAIAYSEDGLGIITISEAKDRLATAVPINLLECR